MAQGFYYSDPVAYPEDIAALKEAIPEIRPLHDTVVAVLYADFSTTWYCAGWIGLDIEGFKLYLLTDCRDWSEVKK